MQCPNCGKETISDHGYCLFCGQNFPPPREPGETIAEPGDYRIGWWLRQSWNLWKPAVFPLLLLALIELIPWTADFALANANAVAERFGYRALVAALAFSIGVGTPLEVGIVGVFLHYVREGRFMWSNLWVGFRKWGSCAVLGAFLEMILRWPELLREPTAAHVELVLTPLWLLVSAWGAFASLALSSPGARLGTSAKIATHLVCRNWVGAMLMIVAAALVCLSGILALGIGILSTIGISGLFLAVAFDDLVRGSRAA